MRSLSQTEVYPNKACIDLSVNQPKIKKISNAITTKDRSISVRRSENNGVIEAFNSMPDGTCRTLKSQYYKTSGANFERTGSMGASGVIERLKDDV